MQTTIIISTLIISVAALVGLRLWLQSKERRTMIEKGLDPALVDIASKKKSGKMFLYSGILLLGISLGTITGIILDARLDMPMHTEECILLSVIVFTGFSSFVCHYLSRDNHV